MRTADALAQRAEMPLPDVDVVPLDAASAITGEWRELVARAVEPNPFHMPEFLLPALAYLKPEAPRLVLVRTAGRLIAVVADCSRTYRVRPVGDA